MKKRNQRKSDDSDDDDSDVSVQVDTNNAPKYIPVAKLGDKLRTKKIVINISDTQYPVVQEVAEELGWVVQREEGGGDWDLWWTDRQIEPQTLFRMNLQQKINHYPGIFILARKNLFGLGLMAMKEFHPEQYDFFPETWTLPLQFSQFRHYYQSTEKSKPRTFIVKPEALSQGRGIFLTRNIEDILNGNKYVIQNYIKNPLLIDKLKFDLRIYVLLAGTDPLRLYIYHEGLTRFATEEYRQPTNENLNCSYIHLTNYSLNKNNPKYVFNSSQKDMDKGHKRTLSSTYQKLLKNGVDVEALKTSIEDSIIKSVISGLPAIRHQYQYCQPEEYEGNMCFHILGFDVMLTDDYKPIVIEVNHTPSFQTGTPLDYLVKKNLIKDTLKLMRITQKNKKKNFQRAKQIAKMRLETGRRDIFKGKQREQVINKAREVRDELQKELMGGYKRIFPPYDPDLEQKYNKFYETALKISRQDNDVRKKILNEENKKEEEEKKKKKDEKKRTVKIPKKAMSKEQKSDPNLPPSHQTHSEAKQLKTNNEMKQSKPKIKSVEEAPFQTLQQLKDTEGVIYSHIRENVVEDEIMESPYSGTSKGDPLKSSFRMKINKKMPGSNNQLVKYTESIKRFNDLMVKYVVAKDPSQGGDSGLHRDSQTFQKLKKKISINREQKSNSKASNRHQDLKDINPLILIPGKAICPVPQNCGVQCLKIDARSGSFVKPKNYLISDIRDSHNMRFNKKWSAEEERNSGKQLELGGNQQLLGGLIVETRSSKAYSKLLKAPVGKALGLRR